MRCFTLTETKNIGLNVIIEDGFPAVRIGRTGEFHFVPLSEHFQELVKRAPAGALKLWNMPIEWLSWKPESEELGLDQDRSDSSALVHIATPVAGGLHFQSCVFSEKIIDDEVIDNFESFPPAGVEILALGGDENHMLLRMRKKSKFRILRPGVIGNRWHWAKVIWTGRDLLVHPHVRKQRQTRAA